MSLPDVSISILSRGLGVVPPGNGLSALVGCCSGGTVGAVVALSDQSEVAAALGVGPLADAAAYHLQTSGQPVLAVRATTATPGDAGAITAGAGNTGTGDLSEAGNATDDFDVIVEITQAGVNLAAETAAFKYSLDGGDSYSQEIAVPLAGSYLLPNTGITVTFVDGGSGTSFQVGDTYSFSTTPPAFDLSGLGAALDALHAQPLLFDFVHVVGGASSTIAAGVDAKLETWAAEFRYARAILEARDQDAGESVATWRAALIADFASFESAKGRVAVCAGYCELIDPRSQEVERRSVAWPACARLAAVEISQSPAEVETLGGTVLSLYHDANLTETALDTARFVTLRTFTGRAGTFISRFPTMAALDSDFSEIMNGRVVDRACFLLRSAALDYLNKRIIVSAETGKILESEARRIEQRLRGIVAAGMVGQQSALSVLVDRNENMLSTRRLKLKLSIVPFAYANQIEATIGLENPALQAA